MRNRTLVGITAAAATTLACHADIVYSGPIAFNVNASTPYTMSITESGTTYTWEVGYVVGGPLNYSFFTATSPLSGVAITAVPTVAKRFGFESGIGAGESFGYYATEGANNNRTLHDYAYGTGDFPAFGATQYAGFTFGGPGNTFYGWLSLTMAGPDIIINDYAYNNGSIGAGMLIPAPGAIALLGIGGLVGRRRRA